MPIKTTMVIRDTDKPFEPSTGNLPESDRYVWSNKRARVVPASIVKTSATRVLVVAPEQLAAINRLFASKAPEKVLAKYLEIDGILSCFDVLKDNGKLEVVLRACVDRRYMEGAENGAEMLTHDVARLRRLPAANLRQLAEFTKDADLSELPSKGKYLRQALELVPDEGADESSAACRIDFSNFEAAEGIARFSSATKLAVGRIELKRKRDQLEAEKEELASMVKLTRLPDGQVAFTFPCAKGISAVGNTAVVRFAENAEDEEATE